jgi:hypothetical protein
MIGFELSGRLEIGKWTFDTDCLTLGQDWVGVFGVVINDD